jgi:hypothetical protein
MIALALAAVLSTSIPAQRWLTFDFPAVRVGVAEYDDGPTGATVFYFPKPMKAAVDVRGRASTSLPGSR